MAADISWKDATLRDMFAVEALGALVGKSPFVPEITREASRTLRRTIAMGAYAYADAMIEARSMQPSVKTASWEVVT